MKIPAIFQNQRYKFLAIGSIVFSLGYILVDVFVIGGDSFIIKLNDTIVVPLAILTTVCALILWSQVRSNQHSSRLWGGLMVGWGLWALAETIWAVYSYRQIEIPDPSIADFFWLVGYIPISYAFFNRLAEMPGKLSRAQQIVMVVFTLLVVTLTGIYVLFPIMQTYQPDKLLASAIALFYPLADLLLLIFGVRLLLIYRSGDYGFGWNLITAGFLLTTLSDLLYSYASIKEFYHPNGIADLFSSLAVSVPYNLSYLAWVLGIYAISLTLSNYSALEKSPEPKLVANTHVLVFTKADATVTSVSDNYEQVFGLASVHNKGLDEVLNILPGRAKAIFEELHRAEKVTDWPIRLENRMGAPRDGCLSGISIINSRGEYNGGILCARMLFESEHNLDENLNAYEKSMILQVRKLSGSHEEAEICALLTEHYSNLLKQLYNLVFHTGGAQMGAVFLERLRETNQKNQWPLQFNPQTLLTDAEYHLSTLQEALPVLLETARQFTLQVTDDKNGPEQIFKQISPNLRANVEYHCGQPASKGGKPLEITSPNY